MKSRTKKTWSSLSLTATLAIAFLALSIVLLITTTTLQLLTGLQVEQKAIVDRQQVIARDAGKTVTSFIQENFSVLKVAVGLVDPFVVPAQEREQILEALLGAKRAFIRVVLLSPTGVELSVISRQSRFGVIPLGEYLGDEALVQLNQKQDYASPVYIDDITSEPRMVIAVPIENVLGDYVGILAAEVNLKFMWDLVDQLQVGEEGNAYVVDQDGMLIAFSDTARVLKGENLSHLQVVNNFINSNPESTTGVEISTYTGIDGATVVGTYVPLGIPDWAVVTELPWQEAYSVSIRQGGVAIVIAFGMVVFASIVGFWVARFLTVPLTKLTNTASRIAAGEIGLQADTDGPKEIASLAKAFNSMTTELHQLLEGMEQRVVARTRDLELAADVAQRISSLHNLTSLLTEAVETIRERFNLYYVQIYLADAAGRSLTLRAGTGDVGATLFRRGHRLPIDLASINGTAVVERRAVIVEDTATSLIHRPNLLLPDTRSEMAVPMIIGERVIGVLDVQSDRPGALSAENLLAYQTLAGQLAIAIQNATLFTEAEQARSDIDARAHENVRTSWRNSLDAIQNKEYLGYSHEDFNVKPLEQPLTETGADDLVVPIQISGEPLGKLQLQGKQVWTEDDKTTSSAIAQLVAQQVENLRLLVQAEHYQTEAQDALRRLTREGWQGTQETNAEHGYLYKDYEVHPGAPVFEDADAFQTFLLTVREEPIGEIIIAGSEKFSAEDEDLLTTISQQLSTHLESLRLAQQTELALVETEELYAASARIIRATSMDDVLRSVVESSALKQFERASILIFDRVWDDKPPETGVIVGAWAKTEMTLGISHGTVFPIRELPFTATMRRDMPFFIWDVETDDRLDDRTRAVLGRIGKSMGFFPLLTGEQWFGFVIVAAQQPMGLAAEQLRQTQSLVSQAASVVQSIRLYEQTQATLAQTETLYEIGRLLNNANNVDEILEAASLPARQRGCREASLLYFDLDENNRPETIAVMAAWSSDGRETLTVGSSMPVAQSPFRSLLDSGMYTPRLIANILDEENMPPDFKEAMSQMGSQAITVIPLVQAGRWLGSLIFRWADVHPFSQDESDIYGALIGLVAPAIQSRRLLIQAQSRAQREQALRQITSAVRASTDPVIIMRTAVREIGTILGRKALIRIERPDTGEQNTGQDDTDAGTQLQDSVVSAM